jgi:hypothetical protein
MSLVFHNSGTVVAPIPGRDIAICTAYGDLGAFVWRISLGDDPNRTRTIVDLVDTAANGSSRDSAAVGTANHARDGNIFAVKSAGISLKLGDGGPLRAGSGKQGDNRYQAHRKNLYCSGHAYLLFLLKIEREEILDLEIQFRR